MHPDQLDVDADVVRDLVATQFPGWHGLPVVPVRSHGTVNALFRLGPDLVVRLPLRVGDPLRVRAELEAEVEAARRLRGRLPVGVPEPVVLGGPGSGYPLPWAVHRWLPGTTLDQLGPDPDPDLDPGPGLDGPDPPTGDQPTRDHLAREQLHPDLPCPGEAELAGALAAVVRALRAMPVGDHRFTGRGRGGDLRDHDGVVTEHLARSGDLVDVAAVARVWAEVRDTPHDVDADRWTHGDLMPGNLLTDGRRLTAVLDVGGLGVADPALDLMPAWNLFGRTGRAGFRAALDVDDAQWARGRGWALVQAVACLDYYVATNPVMSAIAHRTLTALITS